MLPMEKSMTEELADGRRAMDRIWDRYSGDFFPSAFGEELIIPVHLADAGDYLVAEIEIPGIRLRNIDISVTEDRLTISGEKKQKNEKEMPDYHTIECRYGKFSLSIHLPLSVTPDQGEAYYKDGVLRITIGKQEKDKPTRIKVKAA